MIRRRGAKPLISSLQRENRLLYEELARKEEREAREDREVAVLARMNLDRLRQITQMEGKIRDLMHQLAAAHNDHARELRKRQELEEEIQNKDQQIDQLKDEIEQMIYERRESECE